MLGLNINFHIFIYLQILWQWTRRYFEITNKKAFSKEEYISVLLKSIRWSFLFFTLLLGWFKDYCLKIDSLKTYILITKRGNSWRVELCSEDITYTKKWQMQLCWLLGNPKNHTKTAIKTWASVKSLYK